MVLEKMEFSKIQNARNKFIKSENQQSTMFINDGRNLMDYDFVPMQSTEQRILFLDDHGVLREAFTDVSYLLSHNIPDDNEIPPHVLDHMYAKKPREPGSEQSPAKPRRRAKRKEQIVEQFVLPDDQPPAPKINIIRQTLPSTVYKSLSACSTRPKILQGGGSPQKLSAATNSSSQPTSPNNKLKLTTTTSPSKTNTHLGRTSKKEEPAKTMYASFDEVNKLFTTSKSLFGSSNKYAKDSKSYKSSKSLSNSSNTIIMDEVGAAYDEEMLFDFGITEDDEAITCTLGTDGFSDGEFDEFGVGLEVYNSNPSSTKSSLSKSPITTSGILVNQRPIKSSISEDDDDSNQIMVSIHNNNNTRRPSQDWDSVHLFDDQAIKQELNSQSIISDLCANANTTIYKSTVPLLTLCKELNVSVKSETTDCLELESSKNIINNGAFIKKELSSLHVKNRSKTVLKDSPSSTTNTSLPPTRRSSRVLKTPAWLEEFSDKIPIVKKQRKKS